MRIRSNIATVLKRVEALKADIPQAVALSLRPSEWLADGRATAEAVLRAMADADQMRFIPEFVETVTASLLEGKVGVSLKMRSPRRSFAGVLGAAQEARPFAVFGPEGNLFAASVVEMEELILEWVNAPVDEGGKIWDERDEGKTPEEVAHLISYILLSPNLGPAGVKAREGLMPHVLAFIQRKQQQEGIDPAMVDVWLRAVLFAWREMFREKLAAKVHGHLVALRKSKTNIRG